MVVVFVDTSYLIASANPKDAWAAAALSATHKLGPARMHTTQEVLSEFLSHFSRSPLFRPTALELVDNILLTPSFIVHEQGTETFQRALDLYRRRMDKGYSLVDCRSMLLMRELRIRDVLTGDKHFAQEGFNKLY